MADIGRIDLDDIPMASDSLLDMIRVACYVHQVDKAIALAHHCMDKGYEVCINLMAVSTVNEHELDEALKDIAQSRVKVFYAVDSFGSMYFESIQHLVRKYINALPGKEIGIHAAQQHADGDVEYVYCNYGRLYYARCHFNGTWTRRRKLPD